MADPRVSRPNPVDVHVGTRVRLRRTLLGMSQQKLGEAVGLTFQQIQKYERGVNRIGSSRLYHLAQVLEVPVSYFFDHLPVEPSPEGARGLSEAPSSAYGPDPLAKRETLEFVRAYYRISDPELRKRVFDLTKTLAELSENENKTLAKISEQKK